MLGHWHRIDGTVAHGDKRGRDLGYPTANILLEGLMLPRFGVYAVEVDVLTGPHKGTHGGAASIGVRPTFGINAPNLEVYLFDFEGDLYGEEISVALVSFLRGEARFDDVDALVRQMEADCALARAPSPPPSTAASGAGPGSSSEHAGSSPAQSSAVRPSASASASVGAGPRPRLCPAHRSGCLEKTNHFRGSRPGPSGGVQARAARLRIRDMQRSSRAE